MAHSRVEEDMTKLLAVIALLGCGSTPAISQKVPPDDAIRIREFYKLAAAVQDKVWPNWSQVPAPLLVVTDQNEFLTHYPDTPKGFAKISGDFCERPRQFGANLQATFPAFGPTPVIVIGEPANTASKTSTPWLITLMHEHFHQLQDSQPGYFEGVDRLGLSRGDNTGMWMLNYPFPYQDVSQSFGHLRDLLVAALSETDPQKFAHAAQNYVTARKQFFAQLSPDDHRYLAFQLWQEGIARYTELKVAEASSQYRPSQEYAALQDYQTFDEYAAKAKLNCLDELRNADVSKKKREVVYSWGAAEGLLLDRIKPKWREKYFAHPFTLDYLFE